MCAPCPETKTRAPLAWLLSHFTGETAQVKKRTRTEFPRLAATFVDAYLSRYVEAQGRARKELVSAIKKAMVATDPTWESLEIKVIETRLQNENKKTNKRARVAAAEIAEHGAGCDEAEAEMEEE